MSDEEELIEVVAGDWLASALGLPPGALALIQWFVDDDVCVDEDCGCEDTDCPKVSVDGEEVGCGCCCDV